MSLLEVEIVYKNPIFGLLTEIINVGDFSDDFFGLVKLEIHLAIFPQVQIQLLWANDQTRTSLSIRHTSIGFDASSHPMYSIFMALYGMTIDFYGL